MLARGLPLGVEAKAGCVHVMETYDKDRKDWQMGQTKVCCVRTNFRSH